MGKSQWPSQTQWPQDTRGQVWVYKYFGVVDCNFSGRRKPEQLQTVCEVSGKNEKIFSGAWPGDHEHLNVKDATFFYLAAKMQHHFFLEGCLLLGISHTIRGKLVIRYLYVPMIYSKVLEITGGESCVLSQSVFCLDVCCCVSFSVHEAFMILLFPPHYLW